MSEKKINMKVLLDKVITEISKEIFRILAGEKQELISEFANDLCSLQGIGGIPLVYEPLRDLIEKWEERLPDATGEG